MTTTMNKRYLKPSVTVMAVQAECHICAGSTIGTSDKEAKEDASSKGNVLDFDETDDDWQ